ncbi:MAG: HPF/RaiA family ribosome-associated protein [Terriglobales bacterium]
MNVQFTLQVPKSPDLDAVIARSMAKLERLLVVFRPGLVHLHGRLNRHTAREGTLCSLNLHLPTGQLAAEANAPTAQGALRIATQELTEQIKKHKQRLRELGPRVRAGAVAPVPLVPLNGSAPGLPAINVAEFLATNLQNLKLFVTRQLQRRQALGQLDAGQLDAREVLDETVALALGDTVRPPQGVLRDGRERERWFYVLAVQAMRRLIAEVQNGYEADAQVSLDRALDDGDQRLLEHQEGLDRYDDLRLNDVTADDQAASPEQEAYGAEVWRALDGALQRLPPTQREDMVLFAMDGFSVAELAMISQRTQEEVHAALLSASRTLEQASELPPEIRGRLVQRTARRLSGAA